MMKTQNIPGSAMSSETNGPRARPLVNTRLLALAVALALGLPTGAATFNVTNTTELIAAINAANDEGANPGADTVVLVVGGTFVLTGIDNYHFGPAGLPVITSEILIQGNGQEIERNSGAPAFRIFTVGSGGNLALENVIVSRGLARGGNGGSNTGGGGGGGGGMGGAIYIQDGKVTLIDTTLDRNDAEGGVGGYTGLHFSNGGGAGGGGVGGNGASLSALIRLAGAGGGGTETDGSDPIVASPALGGAGGTANGGDGADEVEAGVGNQTRPGENGGYGGGGGGGGGSNYGFSSSDTRGGDGGYGGGGGGAGGGAIGQVNEVTDPGGDGGFGGGGGGAYVNESGGTSLFGGGAGGNGGQFGGGAGGGGAGLGGAVYNESGALIVQRSTLSGNSATGGQGGQRTNQDGNPGTSGSGCGGAIFNHAGTVDIRNSTITGNDADPGPAAVGGGPVGTGEGGGIYNHSGAVTLLHVTVYDNSADGGSGAGGGIGNHTGTVELKSTTAAGNVGTNNISGSVTDLGNNLTSGDPMLSDLLPWGGPTETHYPLVGSPLREAGSNVGAPATDQRGVSRPFPVDGTVDIGAVEANFGLAPLQGGEVIVADGTFEALFQVDPVTGDRTILSMAGIAGTGPAFSSIQGVVVTPAGDIFALDSSEDAVFQIDPANGDRTIISQASTTNGTGPSFTFPKDITIDGSGMLLATDSSGSGDIADAVFKIDPATGNRVILSADNVPPGEGNKMGTPKGIIDHSSLGILVVDSSADFLIQVSDPGGNRTVISDATTPDGNNPFNTPNGMVEDTDGTILVTDSGTPDQILRVDQGDGERTQEIDLGAALGSASPQGITRDSLGGIYFIDGSSDQLYRLSGGGATLVSGAGAGSGPLFGSLGIGISAFPIPTPPTLEIVRGGLGQVTISWSPDDPGWVLQETLSLSPANWTNSPSGSTNPVTVPAGGGMQYYRLHKP